MPFFLVNSGSIPVNVVFAVTQNNSAVLVERGGVLLRRMGYGGCVAAGGPRPMLPGRLHPLSAPERLILYHISEIPAVTWDICRNMYSAIPISKVSETAFPPAFIIVLLINIGAKHLYPLSRLLILQ